LETGVLCDVELLSGASGMVGFSLLRSLSLGIGLRRKA
jgi:hypothetical protein